MEKVIGIIWLVLIIVSLFRGFMLYPKTKGSFGLGKEFSSTISTICGILYIVALFCLSMDKWAMYGAFCLMIIFVLQIRYLMRSVNVLAMARVTSGPLPWKDDLLLSPLHTWYVVTLTGVMRVVKLLMYVTIIGIPAWKYYENTFKAADDYVSYHQEQDELEVRYKVTNFQNEAREIARELNEEMRNQSKGK